MDQDAETLARLTIAKLRWLIRYMLIIPEKSKVIVPTASKQSTTIPRDNVIVTGVSRRDDSADAILQLQELQTAQ